MDKAGVIVWTGIYWVTIYRNKSDGTQRALQLHKGHYALFFCDFGFSNPLKYSFDPVNFFFIHLFF